jgi:3-oxoacyl-[acyl-carrier protein] reductase
MSNWLTIEELKRKGITVYGKNILISAFVNIYNPTNLFLHDNIRIDDFTTISCKGKVEIFNHVHIGSHCMISSSTNIIFGNYTGISSGVKLFGGCDDFSGDFLTNPTIPKEYLNVQTGDIILEDHVLIGASSIVLPDVILREGTSVGALSIVKKTTEPWKIYVGCPIKILKDRNKNCLKLQKDLEAEELEKSQTEKKESENFEPSVDYSKKTIFITGGSKGIGKAIALHFKTLSYNVIVSYKNSLIYAKELENEGIFVYKMDVTCFEECKEVIQDIIKRFKKIDILVNNAGIIDNVLFHKMTSEQWTRVINTNLTSLYNVSNNVIQNMVENKNGKIINISSISGLKGSKGQTNYSSSKHGVIGFTKSLALEYGNYNILVNCICPGLVKTDMFDNINSKITDKIIESNPIKKVIETKEIARACEFFINSEFCTGSILNIDCGMNC